MRDTEEPGTGFQNKRPVLPDAFARGRETDARKNTRLLDNGNIFSAGIHTIFLTIFFGLCYSHMVFVPKSRKKGSRKLKQHRHPQYPSDTPTPGIGPAPAGR